MTRNSKKLKKICNKKIQKVSKFEKLKGLK